MDAHVNEWLSLLVRWLHFIFGVAWIGASFYFNWLENQLDRSAGKPDRIAGDLWAVHGGGFYYLQKYKVAPESLPPMLHWFKWEAYLTWISGVALLAVVYFANARSYMIDPTIANLSPLTAVAIAIAVLVGAWVVYDRLCESKLKANPMLLSAVGFGLLIVLAVVLTQLYSGRTAYILMGAAIGTCMVGNVFFVIIPSQRELVNALKENREPDGSVGKRGLLRSRHNNYLTLPVLFMMISNHYPSTYGAKANWLVLAAIMVIGFAVRHYFNVRHIPEKKNQVWILPAAAAGMIALAVWTAPAKVEVKAGEQAITVGQVKPIIDQRCVACHSAKPTMMATAPLGFVVDTPEQIKAQVAKIGAQIASKAMPLGNVTQMTDDERALIGKWIAQGAN